MKKYLLAAISIIALILLLTVGFNYAYNTITILLGNFNNYLAHLITKANSWHYGPILVLASFVYGVLHAVGPGHGKFVLSSYSIANNPKLKKLIVLAMTISILQGLTAVIIGSLALVFFQKSVSQFLAINTNIVFVSAALLLSLSLFWLIRAGYRLTQILRVSESVANSEATNTTQTANNPVVSSTTTTASGVHNHAHDHEHEHEHDQHHHQCGCSNHKHNHEHRHKCTHEHTSDHQHVHDKQQKSCSCKHHDHSHQQHSCTHKHEHDQTSQAQDTATKATTDHTPQPHTSSQQQQDLTKQHACSHQQHSCSQNHHHCSHDHHGCSHNHHSCSHDAHKHHTCSHQHHEHHEHHEHGPDCGCGNHLDWNKFSQIDNLRDRIIMSLSVILRPCTGAIFVLIFAYSINLWWWGVASAMVMAVGTGIGLLTSVQLVMYIKKLGFSNFSANPSRKKAIWLQIFFMIIACSLMLVSLNLAYNNYQGTNGNRLYQRKANTPLLPHTNQDQDKLVPSSRPLLQPSNGLQPELLPHQTQATIRTNTLSVKIHLSN